MKCSYHPDLDSANSCATCSRPLCASCSHSIKGRIYCQDCIVEGASLAAVARSPQVASYSPARAAFFALIPGIGAVYNRQYSKALVHFATFISLILLADYVPEVFVLAAISFYIFTIIDAYRSAQWILRKRIQDPAFSEEDDEIQLPLWGGLLILLGAVFFLSNLGVFNLRQVIDFGWPLLFVAAGAYLILAYLFKTPQRSAGKPRPDSDPDPFSPPPAPPTPPAETTSQGE